MKNFIFLIMLTSAISALTIAQTINETKLFYPNPTSIAKITEGSSNSYAYAINDLGRKKVSSTISEIYRSFFYVDLSTIPTNATITEVKVNYSTEFKSYSFKLTNVSSIVAELSSNWAAIGNGSSLNTGVAYGATSFISSGLKTAIQNALPARYIRIGAVGENEIADDSYSTLSLSLEVKYTRPAEQLTFIAKNDMDGQTAGQIGVGVNTAATSQASPYTFTPMETNTIYLQAYDNQSSSNYIWLYNDSEAPLNQSKWNKNYFGATSEIGTNSTITRTAMKSENGATFLAVLRKKCNITFSNETGAGTIKVNGIEKTSLPFSTTVIEKNAITGLAINHSANGIDFHFDSWSPGGSTSYQTTFNPVIHSNYVANFIGRANNYYRNQYFNAKVVGQPIKVYWSQHPNTNVTQYKVYRKPKYGSESCVGTFARTGTSSYVYTFTDPDMVHTNSSSSNDLYYYDVRAYYSPDGTYSDYDFKAVYAEMGGPIADDSPKEERMQIAEKIYEYGISNYPNPYNPTTTISYSIKEQGNVQITVYDALGRKVADLVNEIKQPGSYNAMFNGSNLTSGIYFYTMKVNDFMETKKMLLTK